MKDRRLATTRKAVTLLADHVQLHGDLVLPALAGGLVVLPQAGADARAGQVAGILQGAGLSTLVIDLLAAQEERFADRRTNVPLLAQRLLSCLAMLKRQQAAGEIPALPLGLLGAGHVSPVVLRVAALRDADIAAIVCRGGLIDLAGALYLRTLAAPLLMIAAADDTALLAASRRALQRVASPHELAVVPDGGDGFEHPTAFAAASHLATQWFRRCLAPAGEALANRL